MALDKLSHLAPYQLLKYQEKAYTTNKKAVARVDLEIRKGMIRTL